MINISIMGKSSLVFLFPFILILTSCAVGGIRKVDLPQNMVVFKDLKQKMEFSLPAGWEPAPVDPVVEKLTAGIRTGPTIGFRKGGRGNLAVWCDYYSPNRLRSSHMLDVLREYAPMFQRAEIYYEVESPGSGYLSRPMLHAYKVSQVAKGRKRNFQVVTVDKDRGLKLYACEYMLFGTSSSDEFSEEILTDITAIAATLSHPEE